ncbi:hypothetical protein bcere0016_9460 [Bacillus cereus 95/8201]|uniref:Uncharacterized protein n=2 Tax=Bacillus cereus group TaxID=86661 RepID=A0A0B5P0K6_BACTU|nr:MULTISPECIES: hypothetical protein [Bacillus]ACK87764.1 conserved hypothetical protein [Bacillus cereus AH820]AJG79247.1 hypothetical protein BF38_2253 [Bacillus thuringiensis]AJH62338.1 hypothetical protein BG11_2679 [Bacillus cereus]AJH80653.1 hypothetical protein BF36_3906 [Bacillus thuringiensis]AJK32898.1 hypothetical protein BF33_3267 [Bacillus cereus]
MKYRAYVEKTDELIDEEVTININGVVFTGFSTVCSYKIEEGKSYPVIFDITVFDNIEINEGIEGVKSLKRIDNSFKYRISGILNRGFIDAGIIITDEDEIFLERSEYFNKYVEIEVDRINIEFVKGG